ncbi:MAG TPA: hypothetical protein VLX85_13985 [Stellaceae bacterium]|nr:hypothetical protein [Stellaceae bacterium]
MTLSKALASLALLVAAVGAESAGGAETSFIAMSDDPDYDAAFRCPEALPAEERAHATRDFFVWARGRHADWTLAEVARYRLDLLERHHCDETLKRIRDSAVAPPADTAQAKILSK